MSRESREPNYKKEPVNPKLDLYDKLKKEGKLIKDNWNHEEYKYEGMTYDVWFSRHGTLQEINLNQGR